MWFIILTKLKKLLFCCTAGGKRDEHLILPLNDSISFTLSQAQLCATTTACISPTYTHDAFWLNGKSVLFKPHSISSVQQTISSEHAWCSTHFRMSNNMICLYMFSSARSDGLCQLTTLTSFTQTTHAKFVANWKGNFIFFVLALWPLEPGLPSPIYCNQAHPKSELRARQSFLMTKSPICGLHLIKLLANIWSNY